jgi:hypothetical protein
MLLSGAVDPSFPAIALCVYPHQLAERAGSLLFGVGKYVGGNCAPLAGALGERFLLLDEGALGVGTPPIFQNKQQPIHTCVFDASYSKESCKDLELPDTVDHAVKGLLPRAGGSTLVMAYDCGSTCGMPNRLDLARLGPDVVLAEDLTPVSSAVLTDGRIVVSATGPGYSARLLLLSADGVVDKSFGTNGIDSTSGSGEVAALPDGGFLLASYYNGNNSVSRYKADGTLDPSFGQGGRVDAEAVTGAKFTDDYTTKTIFAAKSGAIYIGGGRKYNGADAAVVIKLDGTGKLTESFGSVGIAHGLGVDKSRWTTALAEDAEGRLLVGLVKADNGAGVIRLIP